MAAQAHLRSISWAIGRPVGDATLMDLKVGFLLRATPSRRPLAEDRRSARGGQGPVSGMTWSTATGRRRRACPVFLAASSHSSSISVVRAPGVSGRRREGSRPRCRAGRQGGPPPAGCQACGAAPSLDWLLSVPAAGKVPFLLAALGRAVDGAWSGEKAPHHEPDHVVPERWPWSAAMKWLPIHTEKATRHRVSTSSSSRQKSLNSDRMYSIRRLSTPRSRSPTALSRRARSRTARPHSRRFVRSRSP